MCNFFLFAFDTVSVVFQLYQEDRNGLITDINYKLPLSSYDIAFSVENQTKFSNKMFKHIYSSKNVF